MQTLKTYIKKVKLINPLTLFKKWLLTDLIVDAERLEQRVDSLENNVSVEDLDNRVDNLEYDLEARIESVEDRSETNQESIKNLKSNFKEFHNEYCELNDDLGKRLLEDFGIIKDRFKQARKKILSIEDRLDNELLLDEGLSLNKLDKRVEALQGNINALTTAHNMAEELNKEARQGRSEQSLSDMQRLTFEICHYYGGQFDVIDFDNCYEIISKYDVVWKRNPQPKKTKKQGGK